MAKRGIDISAHQGNIDLSALKSQIDFVIIRVGYGVSGTLDEKFTRNADLCRKLGIPVGFYWYSYALDVEGAKKEAKAFVDAITPYRDITKFGAWFDMEDADGYKLRNGMPSNNTLVEMCITFCEIMKDNGYKTGIYANLSWLMNQLNDSRLDIYDKWVAQWNTTCDYTKKYIMWQYTSDGTVEGIEGRVDMNKYYL